MLEGIKAVIFDLDGTLADSMWMWPEIDIEYLNRYQIQVPKGLHEAIEGMSFTETADYFRTAFFLPKTTEEIKKDWMEMAYDKYANEVQLKPGASEFLDELRKRSIKTGIATSNGRGLVEAVMHAQHLTGRIDAVRTACEVAKGKPSPDIYLKVSEDLQIAPADCLVFEDISMGILAGKNAGMKVCAVEDAFSMGQIQKKKALADYYISDYHDVLNHTYEHLR